MAGIPRSSYYDRNFRQSPALIRARQPYLVKNIVTGLGLSTFAIGVYYYTLRAMSQDEFEDVIVPESPALSGQAANSTETR